MQTGRAYPSSDLYALAVTAIVLLTGKEPQTLFDDVNAVWRWQDEVTVSPELAQVLNKALSYRPGDRFQSVSQMAQALQSSRLSSGLSSATATGATPSFPAPPPASQMKTVAVGRPNPDLRSPSPTNYRPGPSSNPTVSRPTTVRQPSTRLTMPSEQNRPSMLENPLAVGGLAIGLAAIAGFGGWAVVQSLDTASTPTPTITSLPPLESTPTPTPTPTQSDPKPVEYEQPPLNLEPGVTQTVEGNLRGGDKVNYPLTGQAGQTLTAALEGEGVLLSVLGPDGKPVGRRADRVPSWEGELKTDGEYRVQLSPVRGVASSDYRLTVNLSSLPEPVDPDEGEVDPPNGGDNGNGAPTNPTPKPPAQPDIQSQRVPFPVGRTGCWSPMA